MEAGRKPWGLEECRASFEASLREAPQDEEFFIMPSIIYLMLRSAAAQPGASRSTHGTRCSAFLHSLMPRRIKTEALADGVIE